MDSKELKEEVLDRISLYYGFKNFRDFKECLIKNENGKFNETYQLDHFIKEAMDSYAEGYIKNFDDEEL